MKSPLEVVNLVALMARTSGSADVTIGLIDGPVKLEHPDLASANIRRVRDRGDACANLDSAACLHGTFIAGLLAARRASPTPGVCPDCTLLVRSLFTEHTDAQKMPSAAPVQLADAIVECVDGGARILNLSIGLARPSTRGDRALEQALDYAVRRGVVVIAAAGNQGMLGSSSITRHPWVIPVIGCDLQRRPMKESNLGTSIGLRGLSAPGEGVVGLDSNAAAPVFRGTSVAVPFVTGTIALLWSEVPDATPARLKRAIAEASPRRSSVVPPLLDADAAYRALVADSHRTRIA